MRGTWGTHDPKLTEWCILYQFLMQPRSHPVVPNRLLQLLEVRSFKDILRSIDYPDPILNFRKDRVLHAQILCR